MFLVVVLQIMFGGVISGSSTDQLREIKLIRRAFLDVAGVVPVAEEIEWFVVYNRGGYPMAIDYLYSKYAPKMIKEYMLSDAYKTQPDRALSKEEIHRNLLYVVGLDINNHAPSNINKAKQTIISMAQKCSDNTDDVIDYVCNALMCRVSTVEENNMLSRKFKDACALGDEQRAWILVVNEIMRLPDVCHK